MSPEFEDSVQLYWHGWLPLSSVHLSRRSVLTRRGKMRFSSPVSPLLKSTFRVSTFEYPLFRAHRDVVLAIAEQRSRAKNFPQFLRNFP